MHRRLTLRSTGVPTVWHPGLEAPVVYPAPRGQAAKRTALVAAELFLQINNWRLVVDDADCVLTMLLVATGDITEDVFADWLRLHAHKKLVK